MILQDTQSMATGHLPSHQYHLFGGEGDVYNRKLCQILLGMKIRQQLKPFVFSDKFLKSVPKNSYERLKYHRKILTHSKNSSVGVLSKSFENGRDVVVTIAVSVKLFPFRATVLLWNLSGSETTVSNHLYFVKRYTFL